MKEKDTPSRNDHQLIDLMRRMQKLRLGDFPKGRFKLSYPQMALIMFVYDHPGQHLQDVADGMELTAPTVSVSIRRMEEDGWIERRPDPEDGRATCIFLTDKSEGVMEKISAAQKKGVQMFLSQLTDKEQNRLMELMNKAITGMEQQQKH